MFVNCNEVSGIPDCIGECLTENVPCKECPEQVNKDNPYYEWSNCGLKCPKYYVWVFKCITKLRYFEQQQKINGGFDAPDTQIPISITCTATDQGTQEIYPPIPSRAELDKKWTRLAKMRKKKREKK